MSGTYAITMGDRGRLVVPAAVRAHAGLDAGVPLILLETPGGLVVMTRDQARDHLRSQLAGADLVSALLADRRAAAEREDAA
ncbi:AbrB/MazE/SpoVT family DNA-binding domain-containing protein [Cellulomonas sp. P22]|uniref:AbrB/MazE/SpoVT family DNA-binding domain-containing protein n=1 Tax=Cellulomonas sp. P22 TaxID=3373189 RepID=UPI00379AD8EC